jgi:hypothetical protein
VLTGVAPGHERIIGDYPSGGLNTGLIVTVHKDGVITFALADKPEGELIVCLIDMETRDFARFDQTVQK